MTLGRDEEVCQKSRRNLNIGNTAFPYFLTQICIHSFALGSYCFPEHFSQLLKGSHSRVIPKCKKCWLAKILLLGECLLMNHVKKWLREWESKGQENENNGSYKWYLNYPASPMLIYVGSNKMWTPCCQEAKAGRTSFQKVFNCIPFL